MTLLQEFLNGLGEIDLEAIPENCLPDTVVGGEDTVVGTISDDSKKLFVLMRQCIQAHDKATREARVRIVEYLELDIPESEVGQEHICTFIDMGNQEEFELLNNRAGTLRRRHSIIKEAFWLAVEEDLPDAPQENILTICQDWVVIARPRPRCPLREFLVRFMGSNQ